MLRRNIHKTFLHARSIRAISTRLASLARGKPPIIKSILKHHGMVVFAFSESSALSEECNDESNGLK